MSIQLSNRIHLVPVHDIQTINGEVITLRSGKTWYKYFTENELEFREDEKDGEFKIFNQALKPVIVVTKAVMDTLLDRQLVVLLFDTGGSQYIWGSIDNGVQFTITTYTDRYELDMTRQSPEPVF
jgi:hypothetical protein